MKVRRLIGLGEATHGTKEFGSLRHRFFRYLVEERGYRVLILEDTLGQTMRVKDYIRRADLSPVEALTGLSFSWVGHD